MGANPLRVTREVSMTQLLEILREEHRDIEMLLLVLEHELNIFDRAGQPDYQVIRAVIDYFREYPDCCHHPKEDAIFAKLKSRDAQAAAKIGDLNSEHQNGTKRLDLVAGAVESVLGEREVLRQAVDDIIRDFIEKERRHMEFEERVFFPAAARALRPQDWAEINSRVSKEQVRNRTNEEKFNSLRRQILQWEQESADELLSTSQ
jgi:hemerythrin-like domain-containing protein